MKFCRLHYGQPLPWY